MNPPIETRQLRYFLAVAETLHVGRAAERLHMSQPPLTRQIQQLEQRVGTALFDRTGRRMTMTPAGLAFRHDAERALRTLEQAARQAREIGRGARGLVRIGFVSTLLYSILPSLVRDFLDAHEDIEVELQELTADAQLQGLTAGQIDVGFLLCPAATAGLDAKVLHTEPLIACLPERHRLARGRRAVAIEALREEPFVMFPRPLSPGLYDRIIGIAETAGFAMRIRQQAVQMQTIVGLVSAGIGVAIVPACMRVLPRPGVAYRTLSPAAPLVETAIVCPTTASRAAADTFVRFAGSRRSGSVR